MKQSGRERDQIVEHLQEVIALRGYKVAELERHMKRGRGYIGEALRGGKKLTVELILEILTALDARLEEVFALRRPGRRWSNQIAEVSEGEAAVELPWPIREASPLVQAIVLTLAEKGVATPEEILGRQRDLSGPIDDSVTPSRR